MTTEANENDAKPAEAGGAPACGPECDCGKPPAKGATKLKVAICLVVVAAVCGILLFKTTSAKQNASEIGKDGFASQIAIKGKGAVLNSAGQQGGSGSTLSAIDDLNTVAAKLDTVFLVVPGKDSAPTTSEAKAVLAYAERTLNAKGLSTGVYTLPTTSPDYPGLAAKVSAPGIAVLSKGAGIGFASGGITEKKLMQAYVASSRAAPCCPPGGGKSAVPCN